MSESGRPPRLGLIRLFLSCLVGCMAGLVGWMVVMMIVLFGSGPGGSGQAPPILQSIAFLGPAVVVGYWFFSNLEPSHR